ncbi:MAG: S8/S53 family peptidase, partial [Saprospiraceae bacterium]
MERGWGSPSSYIECFEWLLAPYDLEGKNPNPDLSPHVINNSWYCSQEEGCNLSNFKLMQDIVKNLKAAGIVVVVSAGNDGGNGCGSVAGPPAIFEQSFSVGATTITDGIAGFSSRGPVTIDSSFRLKPNVAAPGSGVRSVIRGGGYASYSGTSMAGPHVAGLVALMISANRDLEGRVELIEDIIEATAVPKMSTQNCGTFSGSEIPNAVFGYGRVDAMKAVKRAINPVSSTENITNLDVQIYPNPSDEWVTFVVENSLKSIRTINLFTANGQLVLSQNADYEGLILTVDVRSLPTGLYLYEVKSGNSTARGKLIKL